LKDFNGIYSSHIRGRMLFVNGEGGYDVIGGIKEVINIGKKHDVKVHISHLVGMGQEKEILALINQAIEEGVNLSFDVISNVTGGGSTFYGLMTLLRPWFNVAGTTEQLLKNLRDVSYREYVIKDMQTSKWFYTNEKALPGIESAVLIIKCKEEQYLNKTVKDIMDEFDLNYQEVLLRIIEADPHTKMKYGRAPQKELFKNLMIFMNHEMGMPSTDTFSANFDTMFGGKAPMDMLPHQNNFCAFTHYLMNMKSPTIEETIRKSTGLVAERFGIDRRGLLKEGHFADVLVIDMEALDTNESLLDTRQKPAGITHVFVNGMLTIKDSEYIGSKAGNVLLKECDYHE